jgi:hypothetical protein
MRRAVFVPVALVGLLLGGCGPAVDGAASPASTSSSHASGTSAVSVPPLLPPARSASCPVVSSQEVTYDNAEAVGVVKVSETPAGQPYPVCYFYRAMNGQLGMMVRVYVGDAAVATALVDQAAPVATSNPASEPPGWSGGSMSSQQGAVYAVSHGGTAVIVTSNMTQTIKCRDVATAVVTYLNSH